MKIFIASDHAGYEAKEELKKRLEKDSYDIKDLGTYSDERVDYPDFAHSTCKEVLKNKNSQGILVCGSGIGMSMTANRYDGIRAALCHNTYSAQMARAHNDANVLCLGGRVNKIDELQEITTVWLKSEFEGGRHQGRIIKMDTKEL